MFLCSQIYQFIFVNFLTFRSTEWGVWSPILGLEILPIEKWELRKDLTGITFSTATAHEPPYVDSNKLNQMTVKNTPFGYVVRIFWKK